MMRKRPGAEDLEAWVATAAPYEALPACLVGGCGRDWRPGSGICDLHARRLRADGLEVADAAWLDRQAPFLIVNQFSLAPLEPVVRAELLFALAARDERGQRLDPTAVRQSVAVLAGHRIAAIAAVQLGALPTRATANVDALLRETFRVVGAAFDRYNLERIRAADALLLGANSYRMFMGFWPAQAANPEAGEVHREFGEIYGRIPVNVISDSLTGDDVAQWQQQTTVIPRAPAQTYVKELKDGSDGDIVTFGSRVTWNALLVAGLVDELHLIVGANALGDGTPAFTSAANGLSLAETRRFDDSDNVLLRYTTGR
ncbi:dihydrofolate reductase family protein [Nonomuraea sp. SYSU D8015]|uniref:dihydrofolate reductase family protein n=1 Tax=Nonomuraea sp. SYSU D8015 TaxID=2593644 RepID=UPI001660FFD1|nr:dihydrofolate reductase family protein [Nonomuraea sp. SYSU D8015]